MKVRLVDYTPVIKEFEIPDRFEPLFPEHEDDEFTVEKFKLWKDFRRYVKNDPEINAIYTGALETLDEELLIEW